ncbi:hypothetical protein Vadar_002683 [Vaccinium darrowii]|uniref:Uncharacterized protein n=1 Tax=Vaccinium darrowii TaxID=229202 RepID=A0ACB7YJA8_9ERIC|nr:hypothetical protein Vadar_002683 [Vaccinium darrowii]
MHSQPPEKAMLPIGSPSENITSEEEDHLVRSTKKVKNDHDYSVDMAEDPSVSEPPTVIQDSIMTTTEESHQVLPNPPSDDTKEHSQKTLNFKKALIASKEKEVSFSEDVEVLNVGEEETGETEIIDEDEEQDGIPIVNIPKSLLDYSRKPWENALIVKPIGYPIGYKSLCSKVRPLWDLQGDFSALDIGMGFVVFKFDMSMDRSNVLTNGPWILNDQYITVRAWEPRFKLDEAEEIKTAVWVKFPNFPLKYYYEKNMFRIVKHIGRPIKADATIVETERGHYARVCVEVDLSKPLKSQIIIEESAPSIPNSHNTIDTPIINPPSPAATINPSFLPSQPLSTSPIENQNTHHHAHTDNRSLPLASSTGLHPNQTRGRTRSPGDSRVVNKGDKHESDGTGVQHNRSPVLRDRSGKPAWVGKRPDGSQEDGGME